MTDKLIKEIKWREVHSTVVYLYGSLLQFKEDCVIFTNPRMASGKPIARFVSRTNYQGNRYSPDLPVLVPNRDYIVKSQVNSEPSNRLLLQIDFMNRQGEKIGFEVFRECQGRFTCPEDTFSYQLIFLSAGCRQVVFKNLSIYQVIDSDSVLPNSPSSGAYTDSQLPNELELVRNYIEIRE